ncbi:MAG: hypothetical protein GWN01_14700 [Nitrosopumilaceae archaeon]|nr:hypothetical protein [Nitrosopumilaceae archaeon]NIU88497.1 hypothetical protein [Nitrosopumilaceae archaeon]NIV66740.1 hypothetical protein [Nitrosopumilaceae archaeon]NIX62703.1 hypothetical protein [Nitrosopumilaceae archaeon]
MKISSIREKVVKEVNQIPEEKLAQVLDLIHHFRLGLQLSKKKTAKVTDFAGCWKDMPEDVYQDFIRDITQRRHTAFSRRKNRETDIS